MCPPLTGSKHMTSINLLHHGKLPFYRYGNSKLRKDKQLAQDHQVGEWWNQDKNQSAYTPFFLEAIGRLLGHQSHICQGPKPQRLKTRHFFVAGVSYPSRGSGSSQGQQVIPGDHHYQYSGPVSTAEQPQSIAFDLKQVPAHYDGAGFFTKPLS